MALIGSPLAWHSHLQPRRHDSLVFVSRHTTWPASRRDGTFDVRCGHASYVPARQARQGPKRDPEGRVDRGCLFDDRWVRFSP